MSRIKFNSSKGAIKKIHDTAMEKKIIITEKQKPSQHAIDMFRHKPYCNDLKTVGGTV